MQISFSGVAVGLVAGAAIGFFAATSTNNTHNNGYGDISTGSSANSIAKTSLQTSGDNLTSHTISPSLSSQANATSNKMATAGAVLDISELTARKRRENGFSAELNLMNKISQANFDELQGLSSDLLSQRQNYFVNDALRLVGMRMVELDRDASMNFLIQYFSSGSNHRSVYEFQPMIEALASTHFREIIDWSDTIANPQKAMAVRTQVLSGLARINPEEALALYSASPGGRQEEQLFSLLGGWSELDPEAAMQWALEQPSSEYDMNASEIVFSQWLIADYSSAQAFLNTISDEKIKSRLNLALISEMSVQDPQSAIEHALSLGNDMLRAQAMESALYSWSSLSLMDAIDYATNSLSGRDQNAAFHIIGMAAGGYGGGQLGSSAFETMTMAESMPQPLRNSIQMSTMHSFFEEDPQAAMQWIDTVADPVEREQLLGSVAYDMARTDLPLAQSLFEQSGESVQSMLGNGIAMELHKTSPESAWAWYDQLPAGNVKNEVLHSMIYSEAQTNPENAMQLAMSAPGPHSQDMMFSVFSSAAGANYDWASNWLQQADLSPEIAVQFRAILEDFSFGSTYYRIEQ